MAVLPPSGITYLRTPPCASARCDTCPGPVAVPTGSVSLRTVRSLIRVLPLAAVLAAALAAAGPAAASAPLATRIAAAPAAASAQAPASKIAVPGRTTAAGTVRPDAATLTGQVVSPDFTGYSASGGSYTSVSASWVEPTGACLENTGYITIKIGRAHV